MPPDYIRIPDQVVARSENLNSFIDEIYPNFDQMQADPQYLGERAILTPLNADCFVINSKILDKVDLPDPDHEKYFYSVDRLVHGGPKNLIVPTEYLNRQTDGGLPPHALRVRRSFV